MFLDVDGVLNSASWTERRGEFAVVVKTRAAIRRHAFDPEAVDRLNRLLELSGARIVLSSSWRKLGLDVMRPLFAELEIVAPIIDRTPVRSEHDLELFHSLLGPDDKPYPSGWPRGFEIQQWLNRYKGRVDHIVILDDSWTMKHLEPWQIRTSMADGFCERHIEAALEILERPAPPRRRGRGAGRKAAGRLAAVKPDSGPSLVGQVADRLRSLDGELAVPAPMGGSRTPAAWSAYFDALDRWWRWIELARKAEAGGDLVEANACLGAASWLQPESAESMVHRIRSRRRADVAERIRCQPDPEFAQLDSRARHRRAWDLGADLVELPTLIRHSCDANPSVRASIYRALARQAHPAGFQVLHEGLTDDDTEARLAAIEALGRVCDPTSVWALERLEPPEAKLASAVEVALAGIRRYWGAFGRGGPVARREAWDYLPPGSGAAFDSGTREELAVPRVLEGFEGRRWRRMGTRGELDERRAKLLQRVVLGRRGRASD